MFFIFTCYFNYVLADLPVHCQVDEVHGSWTLRINTNKFQPSLEDDGTSCGHGFPNSPLTKLTKPLLLSFPDYKEIQLKIQPNYKVYKGEEQVGTWTPVYDQSFVIWYKDSVITAPYQYYNSPSGESISVCSKTLLGWYIPDKNDQRKDWSCFFAFKTKDTNQYTAKASFLQKNSDEITLSPPILTQLQVKKGLEHYVKYENLQNLVQKINDSNLTWKADVHEEFVGLSFVELKEKLGMKRIKSDSFRKLNHAKPFDSTNRPEIAFTQISDDKIDIDLDLDQFLDKINEEDKKTVGEVKKFKSDPPKVQFKENNSRSSTIADSINTMNHSEVSKYINTNIKDIPDEDLPKNWDWRNVGGVNYVPSVKKQENCGSCYVFSSVTCLESRLRILTNNEDKTEFSKAFPLSYNFYSEGCDGGYPFFVGKFFSEFEIIPETCLPYMYRDKGYSKACDYTQNSKKYSVKDYGYIGGYYGATNEILMMKEIRARGPIPGNIVVPWTFNYYKKGIFSHSGLKQNAGTCSKVTMVDRNLTWVKVEHSITLIGYGEEDGIKYWIGMNTWGANWGENGFFKIVRGENELEIETMGDFLSIKVETR